MKMDFLAMIVALLLVFDPNWVGEIFLRLQDGQK